MYVGGLVWALDWCPRVHEKPDCDINLEVLLAYMNAFLVYINPDVDCHSVVYKCSSHFPNT